ncbi:16S rRNA (uracil(1498)-N(3))-methyltransferase [Halobacillus fulvus]|nr:16S rRNA (uracil(1498)-N(3))-methyltransferase [Halobacillus fulvus]
MQRYFVSRENWGDGDLHITGHDVHHISRVMRMDAHDKIICIHPDEGAALCEIKELTDDDVICEIREWLSEDRELPVHVTIVQSLGKGDKLEQVVQKGTELGAYSFIPFQADRSVAKWDEKKVSKKVQRLCKIAKEASEQSERTHIPEVTTLYTLNDILELKDSYTWCFFGYAEEARQNDSAALSEQISQIQPGDKVLIMFGPEGGFSEQEVERLKEHQFQSVRLGPRILRMETAPLYFMSALSFRLEESDIG